MYICKVCREGLFQMEDIDGLCSNEMTGVVLFNQDRTKDSCLCSSQ